jgi:hypothetical protein
MAERDAQQEKLAFAIPCTLAGMQTDRKVELQKVYSGMFVGREPSVKVTSSRDGQFAKQEIESSSVVSREISILCRALVPAWRPRAGFAGLPPIHISLTPEPSNTYDPDAITLGKCTHIKECVLVNALFPTVPRRELGSKVILPRDPQSAKHLAPSVSTLEGIQTASRLEQF